MCGRWEDDSRQVALQQGTQEGGHAVIGRFAREFVSGAESLDDLLDGAPTVYQVKHLGAGGVEDKAAFQARRLQAFDPSPAAGLLWARRTQHKPCVAVFRQAHSIRVQHGNGHGIGRVGRFNGSGR